MYDVYNCSKIEPLTDQNFVNLIWRCSFRQIELYKLDYRQIELYKLDYGNF